MNKLAKLMNTISYDDLLKLRKDITSGNMLRIIEERIAAYENPNRVCPVCGTSVDPMTSYTLYFGPKGLRQRASFDGVDCLRQFLDEQTAGRTSAQSKQG